MFPSIESSTACDYFCAESFEVKCLQSARVLSVTVGDDWMGAPGGTRFSDSYTQAHVVGLSPASLNWETLTTGTYLQPGGAFTFTIVRSGPEGTITGIAVVQAVNAHPTGIDRLYAVDVSCWSDVHGSNRKASLIRKFDN